MADAQPTVAEFTESQGTEISVSKLTTRDPSTVAEDGWADLSVTIKEPQFQGGQTNEMDVSTLASKAKEFALGLPDNGTFTMSGNWKAGNEAQTVLRTARNDAKPRAFKVKFTDDTVMTFVGLVTQFQWSGGVDTVISGTFNVRITGEVSLVVNSSQPTPPEGGE